ncbi:short-chain dehydrogenase/reductase family 16C member 6-like [Centruroides sculpturatus]|uniref:short-chain dehydrogenase/reductase family 16C member 6-like n=1 Tax=Centruroides sculpturatus TaxID=218467 RepID=UPI000C6DB1E5|nr:short-chain dehydrogenase/reductase family 16C member 6-like [Centruroides sculpturatus]XP_023223199.1 short-chain dehydrogenase/reductase family 16C member 6-like [Centruroides sculpturatus]
MNEVVKVIVNIFYMLYLWLEAVVLQFVPRKLRYKELDGEIVLITGGGSGIGRLLALRFAGVGCRVVIWDVNEEGNRETQQQVKSRGGECHSYVCDVTDREKVYAVARKVKEEVGPVTILVNNAGIVTGKNLLDIPDHLIEKTFQVNVIAHFWTLKAFLPDMISMNHGHIVTISSLAGFSGINRLSDYCASKSAAIAAHESLHFELKNDNVSGIKMTLVAPFFINTGLFEGADGGYFSVLTPEYVADEVISGVRCNQETVILPSIFSAIVMVKAIMPVTAYSVYYELLQGYNSMKNFVGRSRKNN